MSKIVKRKNTALYTNYKHKTYDTNHSSLSTCGFCKKELSSEHFLGIMTASWEATTERMLYSLYNDAHQLYLARKQYYPETL